MKPKQSFWDFTFPRFQLYKSPADRKSFQSDTSNTPNNELAAFCIDFALQMYFIIFINKVSAFSILRSNVSNLSRKHISYLSQPAVALIFSWLWNKLPAVFVNMQVRKPWSYTSLKPSDRPTSVAAETRASIKGITDMGGEIYLPGGRTILVTRNVFFGRKFPPWEG